MNFCEVIFLVACSIYSITAREPLNKRGNFPFEMIWNVPIFECPNWGENLLGKKPWSMMGFRRNTNRAFYGDEINILYNPGSFPHLIMPDKIINGGLPQAGNLTKHLNKFEQDVKRIIKDKNFDRLAIISFQHWRPVWSLNGWMPRKVYKQLSRDYEQHTNPSVTDIAQVWANAKTKFESAAKMFFLETLKKAVEIRPNALWGFNAYPICYNIRGDVKDTDCQRIATTANADLNEIYAASKALYSSAYLDHTMSDDPEFGEKYSRADIITKRVKEAMRFNSLTNNTYLYVRLHYDDNGDLLSRGDMINTFRESCAHGMRGIILWERSEKTNTELKCNITKRYLEENIWPAVSYTTECQNLRQKESRGIA